MNRIINTLDLGITTYCNRNCPNCCVGTNIPNVGKHTDSEWLIKISKWFQNLDLITITGGEPLVHPEFEFITTRIKKWFRPRMLQLITNGSSKLLYERWNCLSYYDSIRITNYTKDTYYNSEDNTDVVNHFIETFKLKKPSISIIIERPIFKTKIGNGGMCELGIGGIIAIQDRKLYPCCVSPGLKPDVGIEVTENWASEILKVNIPCNVCIFSK